MSLGRVKAIACNRKVHSSLAYKTTQSTYTSWIDGHACVLPWTLDHWIIRIKMLGVGHADGEESLFWGIQVHDSLRSCTLFQIRSLVCEALGRSGSSWSSLNGLNQQRKCRPHTNAKWGSNVQIATKNSMFHHVPITIRYYHDCHGSLPTYIH